MIVYLIGFMGSGKTYLGKILSQQMGVPHVDLDEWIVESSGKSIASIFQTEGEENFRMKETRALAEIKEKFDQQEASMISAIVSCGGGAPCFNGNMEGMNSNGITIWLNPPIETLLLRLENEKIHRPLIADLSGQAMKSFIEQKLNDRSMFYEQAKLIVTQKEIDITLLIKNINHASHIQ